MKTENKPKINVFSRILSRACCIFTPVTLLLYTLGALVSNSEKSFIPTLSTVYIILVISFAISISSLLYRNPKMSFATAHTINFFIFGIFYYFVVVVMRNNASDGGYTLVAMVLYLIVFALVTFCLIGARSRKTKKINEITKYETKFD